MVVLADEVNDEAYPADWMRPAPRVPAADDQDRLEWELRNIHPALRHRAALDPYPFLAKGVSVEVRCGPIRGLRGIVADRARTDRLILQVRMPGAATCLEIDGALLEPLD